MSHVRSIAWWLLLVVFFCCVNSVAFAQQPKVQTTLSSTSTRVGDPVELEISVEGEATPESVPEPVVDGIDVRGRGQSTRIQFVNGDFSRQVTYTFSLIPQREGEFTIPAMEVRVGGKVAMTRELKLKVGPGETAKGAGDLAFGEIYLSKKNAYVGETLTAELRVYLDRQARWHLQGKPTLAGEGYSSQELVNPAERQREIAGKTYSEIIFRTPVTPGKAGKIMVGPASLMMSYSRVTRQPNFDPFGFGGRMGPVQTLTIKVPAVALEVKPLPVERRPASFSGAIGQFTIEATGTPAQVGIGEPLTMSVVVRGTGNFERVTLPPLAKSDGWRTYDAEARFTPGDDLGITGEKTFTLPVTPTAVQSQMPQFELSYFDPDAGEYRSLVSSAAPLTVTGAPIAFPPALAVQAPPPDDILGIVTGTSLIRMIPGLKPPSEAYLLFLAPLPVLLVWTAWRNRKSDVHGQRLAQWKAERAAAWRQVQTAKDRREAIEAAVHWMLADTAVRTVAEYRPTEMAEVLACRHLDEATQRAVEHLFAEHAEAKYAGKSLAGKFGPGERDRLMETLSAMERGAQ